MCYPSVANPPSVFHVWFQRKQMQYLHTHTHTYIQYILAICQKMSWLGTMFVYTSQLILKALMMDFKKLIEGVDWLFICQHSLPILRRTLFHLAMTKRMFSNCNKNNLVRTYPSGKAYVHISRLCYGYIEIPCTLATTKLKLKLRSKILASQATHTLGS